MSDEPVSAALERLSPAELGLPPDARVPFRFVPAQRWSPLVISLPHVGLSWPHDLRPKPQADFARNADYEVQTLYADAASLGAAAVCAVFSRLVVDLNRADDDIARSLVPDHPAPRPRRSPGVPSSAHPSAHVPERPGRGVVWAHAVGNVKILSGPLRYADFRRRIDRYHTPYYRALETLLQRRRQRFGFAILLDAHSMPSSVGADLVVGTLGGASCDAEIGDLALRALRPSRDGNRSPIIVRRDDPYRGGELVRVFGRPRDGLHALQLEVNRAVYMDEVTMSLHDTHDPGTPTDRDRGSSAGSVRAATSTIASRQARDLAELQRRVTCLVAALATVTRDDFSMGPSRPEVGEGAATDRVGDAESKKTGKPRP